MSDMRYFVQVPELHTAVQGFFAGLKSIVDLLVQLLSTEAVVSEQIDGFHRKGGVYGGSVLNLLTRNARKERAAVAVSIKDLILREKATWIDQVIKARDMLVHPRRGVQQLMFELELTEADGELAWHSTHPPHVDGQAIDAFAEDRVEKARQFASEFIAILRPAA